MLSRDKGLVFVEHQLNSDILYLLLYSNCVCFSWKELITQFRRTWLLGTILRHRHDAAMCICKTCFINCQRVQYRRSVSKVWALCPSFYRNLNTYYKSPVTFLIQFRAVKKFGSMYYQFWGYESQQSNMPKHLQVKSEFLRTVITRNSVTSLGSLFHFLPNENTVQEYGCFGQKGSD